VHFFDDAFTFCEARSAGHILVYFIPGDGADTAPGKRRLNWETNKPSTAPRIAHRD
jgi:hypothetical protein